MCISFIVGCAESNCVVVPFFSASLRDHLHDPAISLRMHDALGASTKPIGIGAALLSAQARTCADKCCADDWRGSDPFSLVLRLRKDSAVPIPIAVK